MASKRGRSQYGGYTGRPATGRTMSRTPHSRSSASNTEDHPYGKDWPIISSMVRRRDNYTCMAHIIGLPICNGHYPPPFNNLLHVHHIISWFKSKDNSARNLVTLCKDCHAKYHGRSMGKIITDKQSRAANKVR